MIYFTCNCIPRCTFDVCIECRKKSTGKKGTGKKGTGKMGTEKRE